MSDESTGIALQAAWEVHKKPIKRKEPIVGRSDLLYDRDELIKFRDFLSKRTKAPLPAWWSADIINIDCYPDSHYFPGDEYFKAPADFVKSKAGPRVPAKAEMEKLEGVQRYSANGIEVEFPPETFGRVLEDCFIGRLGKERSALIAFSLAGGFSYRIAGFVGDNRKPAWTADVWGVGRTILAGYAAHRAELVEKDGTLFVFGAESHGTYFEAFDAENGKCLYRFCTAYWFNFPETWKLK